MEKIISKAFREHNIRQRASDGYFSATDMCKTFGKLIAHYNENKSTKNYLNALSLKLNIPIDVLFESRKGGVPNKQGTWVHPQVATHLAMWISSAFAVEVTSWIEEWKNLNNTNMQSYVKKINELEPDSNSYEEAIIRDRIAAHLNGRTEVRCEVGVIDVMTADRIIEVKKAIRWKHAMGQALAYSVVVGLPSSIYLFDHENLEDEYKKSIVNVCAKCGVCVHFV